MKAPRRCSGQALALVIVAGSLLFAQERSETLPAGANAHLNNQASIRGGMMLYRYRCADCHGLDASGYRGPSLVALIGGGTTDERVFQTIRKGVPGTEMPASEAPDDDLLMLIAYLRNISTVTPSEVASGNVDNGRQIFNAQCALCHRVGVRGGRIGPALTRIGITRSRAALLREIQTPNEWVPPGYETVTVVLRDGTRVRGVKKNEDAFSIQVMDLRERIQGYMKSNVREVIEERVSLMPAYGSDRFNETQLNDLLGYLTTLREAVPTPTSSSR